MTTYEMAVAMTNNPAAFKAEMDRKSENLNRRLAASAAKLEGLNADEQERYFQAIQAAPHAIVSKSGKTMKPVPIHEIGMKAAKGSVMVSIVRSSRS